MRKQRIAILMLGRTASGKTTTAKRLAEVLSYQYIPCSYYKRIIKHEYMPSDSFNDELRNKGLELAIEAGIQFLHNKNVIFDSSFGSIIRRKRVVSSLRLIVDSFYYIYCVTSDIEETKKRINARVGRENEDIQFHASSFEVFKHIDKTFIEPDIEELSDFSHSNIFYVDTFNKRVNKLVKDDNDMTATEIQNALIKTIG